MNAIFAVNLLGLYFFTVYLFTPWVWQLPCSTAAIAVFAWRTVSACWLLQFTRFISYMTAPKFLIDWLVVSESWSRYILAFPGGILAAYGLALQIPDVKKMGDRSVLTNLFGSVAAFLLFAFFSGLVVPQNVGGLSEFVNAGTFKRVVGLPVEFFRTGTAFLITRCITSMLSVFELEKQRQLDKSLQAQAVFKERELS